MHLLRREWGKKKTKKKSKGMENEYIIDFTSQIIAAKDKENKEETGCGCGKGCGCESESDESEHKAES